MRGRFLFAFVVGAAAGAVAMPAFAKTCYEIIDRDDVVIFRDVRSPVDLSNAGAPARDALRRRGELLVIFDVDTCVVLGRATPTGSRRLTTDEIVAEWRAMAGVGGWATYASQLGGVPTPGPGATPTPSPAAPARRGAY